MPDENNTSNGMQQMVQRGIPGGFPGRGPRGGFPRRQFPRRYPMRPRIPRYFFFPINYYGFPSGRCYWVDEFGRCCDRYGRCCNRNGRCFYNDRYTDNRFAYQPNETGSWYGVPGSFDMMPDYDEMANYDMDNMYDRDDEY